MTKPCSCAPQGGSFGTCGKPRWPGRLGSRPTATKAWAAGDARRDGRWNRRWHLFAATTRRTRPVAKAALPCSPRHAVDQAWVSAVAAEPPTANADRPPFAQGEVRAFLRRRGQACGPLQRMTPSAAVCRSLPRPAADHGERSAVDRNRTCPAVLPSQTAAHGQQAVRRLPLAAVPRERPLAGRFLGRLDDGPKAASQVNHSGLNSSTSPSASIAVPLSSFSPRPARSVSLAWLSASTASVTISASSAM